VHFWTPPWEPPFVPTGQPSPRFRFEWLCVRAGQLAQAMQPTNPALAQGLNQLASSFFDVFTELDLGHPGPVFDAVGRSLEGLMGLHGRGIDEQLREWSVHLFAGTQDIVGTEIRNLELLADPPPVMTGKPRPMAMDVPKALARAYKTLRSAGVLLQKVRAAGGVPSKDWMKLVGLYRKAMNAVTGNAAR
jgi:hypothetical protein